MDGTHELIQTSQQQKAEIEMLVKTKEKVGQDEGRLLYFLDAPWWDHSSIQLWTGTVTQEKVRVMLKMIQRWSGLRLLPQAGVRLLPQGWACLSGFWWPRWPCPVPQGWGQSSTQLGQDHSRELKGQAALQSHGGYAATSLGLEGRALNQRELFSSLKILWDLPCWIWN